MSNNEWQTPPEIFKKLNNEFHFDLDPCATKDNNLGTPDFFTKEYDGLKRGWSRYKSIFINPPYGYDTRADGSRGEYLLPKWVRKAYLEMQAHTSIKNIVMLLPATVSTKWFHQYVWSDNFHEPRSEYDFKIQIRFPDKRIRYLIDNQHRSSPRFDSMIVIYRRCK
jgi:phage N-6-adenine-methyltransferase